MKKKFYLVIAILFACVVCSYADVSSVLANSVDSVYHDSRAAVDSIYHDGKSAISTLYKDGKNGFTYLYPDIKSAIMSIAHAIGVAAEHVYTVLVKKYFVMGIKELVICIAGLLLFFFGLYEWKKTIPIGTPITYRVIVPLSIFIAGFVTLWSVDYDKMLMGLFNPEYGAINYILEYTKEITK